MEELSKNEEYIMSILWRLEKGLVRDIMAQIPEPKPPYTTVSSVVRLLEKKGYVGHKAYGKTHEYYPLVQQEEYRKTSFKQMVKHFFGGSVQNVLSFMVEEKEISAKEIDELKKLVESYENKDQS
ncbi:BlaI/MecI/CopY family transcriptional regulator [Chondrinema litorale]|uniref:BlaI/MecI/CopY family transcriptional regulator n=1 Tax=Chondrinema litorale TaxID=2994555 RepID=UPI002543BB99|nr:BlaI/MecI/CopY family transcriptional regulator [Chondrinema litorale]UZR99895.1 BlaI/MecI/CopY family transcriptional regulator [Chondrinema litorale]